MARPALTPEQKAVREAEKLEIQSLKRSYNKKPTPEIVNQGPEPEIPPAQAGMVEGGEKPLPDAQKPTFTPFKGRRIERDYSTPKVDQSLMNIVLPEAPTADASSIEVQ